MRRPLRSDGCGEESQLGCAPLAEGDDEAVRMYREGELIAGKYLVERLLGEGGMGVVLAARHVQLEERVAIKFLRPEMMARPQAAVRFLREAKAAVRIKSEHVVRVFDVGTVDDGAPYIVMEHLEGCDLAAWLAQRGRLAVEEAVDFVLQACEALSEAHARGIVHRDLKPSNLFCVRRPDGGTCIKVLDFGISKITTPAREGAAVLEATGEAAVLGSPFYMSPEQMQRAPDIDARADIWALGVVLYQLVTGYQPFGGATVPEVCMKIAGGLPDSLLALRPDAPPRLDAVVRRCLEKDRTRRYASVSDLALALADLSPGAATAEAWGGELRSPAQRRRVGTVLSTIAAVATVPAVVGSVWLGFGSSSSRENAAIAGVASNAAIAAVAAPAQPSAPVVTAERPAAPVLAEERAATIEASNSAAPDPAPALRAAAAAPSTGLPRAPARPLAANRAVHAPAIAERTSLPPAEPGPVAPAAAPAPVIIVSPAPVASSAPVATSPAPRPRPASAASLIDSRR
jgi:serine/threonine-protein kinase